MDQAAKSGMGLGDALKLPAANSQSTVTVLSAPPYGDLWRICGEAAADQRGNSSWIQVELSASSNFCCKTLWPKYSSDVHPLLKLKGCVGHIELHLWQRFKKFLKAIQQVVGNLKNMIRKTKLKLPLTDEKKEGKKKLVAFMKFLESK